MSISGSHCTAPIIAVSPRCYHVPTVARKSGGHYIDPNQELIALGATNLICSLFHGFPVTGSFSRTAVNAASGAQSALSSVAAAVILLVAVYALGPGVTQCTFAHDNSTS